MFLEYTKKAGSIEVICGSMFSGKTEELIRRLKRAQFANQKVEIYKPAVDIRYSEDSVVSHDFHSIPSTPIDTPASMLLLSADVEVVGIDEAQFFDDTLAEVAQTLAGRGIRVFRTDARTHGRGRRRAESPRNMRQMRKHRQQFPQAFRRRPARCARRKRHLRTALPPLLQQGSFRIGTERAGLKKVT